MKVFNNEAIVDARKYVKDGRVVSKAELQRKLQNVRTCYCRYRAKMKSLRAQLKKQAAIINRQNRILERIAAAIEKQEGGEE